MNRRNFIVLFAATALVACGAPEVLSGKNTAAPSRLIVLRHADRTFAMLDEAGVARAARLPEALADLEIDAIYTTPRQRNIDTATPLARARGMEIRTLAALGAASEILDEHPGETVVWVGNQENLGFFYAELGLLRKPPVQFGQIDVITLPAGNRAANVERRRYGT